MFRFKISISPVINIQYSLPHRVRPVLFITFPSSCPFVSLTNSRGKTGKYLRHPESRRVSREVTAVAETTAVDCIDVV